MHAITPDGKTLLLADAFGLTRISLPNKVKTDRKAMTSAQGVLMLDAAGTRALVWDDTWDQIHLVTVPELARVSSFARFAQSESRLLADGQRLVRLVPDGLSIFSLADGQTAFVRFPVASEAPPALSLGRSGVARAYLRGAFAVGDDDTVAILDGEREHGRLLLGAIDAGGQFVTHLERSITLPGGGPLRLTVERGGATLCALEPGVATAYVLHIARDGTTDALTLVSLSMPARDGDAWVTQPAPGELARCDAAGIVTARWPIADAAHHGVGEVMAHGGRAWFVPPHRECLVALPSGEEISRKLAPKEAPVRAYFTPMFDRYNRASAPFGRVHSLGRTSFWNHNTQVSGSFTMSAGDGSLGANMLTAALYQEFGYGDASALAPFQRGGTGMGGYTTALLVPITESEVARVFAACDAHRVWLPYALEWLKELYERRLTGESRVYGDSDDPPGDLAAERVLLHGVLHHVADDGVPALMPHVDAWRVALDDAAVRASLSRLNDVSERTPPRVYEGVAWMIARVLDPAAAARTLAWMLLDGSDRQLNNSEGGVRGALDHVLATHPALRADVATWVAAHDPVPRPWNGGDRRSELLAHVRGASV